MGRTLIAALFLAGSIAGAQPTSAIQAARNTAAVASARNAELDAQQQQVTTTVANANTDDSSAVRTDSAAMTRAAATRALPALTREVFQYDGGGRRDPFLSLSKSGALRPLITDLTIQVIIGGGSSNAMAILHDKVTKDQYRIRVGNTVGRYRVLKINEKTVIFTIEEFGFSRQETLSIGDTSNERGQ